MRQLNEFCTGRINDTYEKQIAESATLLGSTAYRVNERVTNRRKVAAEDTARAAKRKHGAEDGEGDEAAAAAERAESAVRELEGEALELATQIEEAMREALDMQATLEDEKSTLRKLPELVAQRQQEVAEQAQQDRDADEEGAADPPDVPGVPTLDVLKEACDAKAAEYDRLSPYDKYATNNKYIDFRQSWHEGLYQNPDEIPLPDPTRWFDRDGRPRLEARRDDEQGGEGADEDGDQDGDEEEEDDEIQIAREKRSFRCPLSLAIMREPFTCRICKHSFERSAITEYIKGPNGRGRVAKCPVPGCNVAQMTLNDFYPDDVLLRKIKRAEQAEREATARSSDQEDDEGEEVEGEEVEGGEGEGEEDDDEEDSYVSRASRASTAKRAKTERRRGGVVESDDEIDS